MKARRTPFAMVPLWVYDHPEVTSTVLQVYLGVAVLTYDRSARSSVAEIGDRAGLGKSATYAALGTLAALGAVIREGRDAWYLPMDEPAEDSVTAEKPSAVTESDSVTADDTSSRDLSREEERARDDPRAQFDDYFWPSYPARNGRKIGKADALAQWTKLSIDDRRAALRGARIMAVDVTAGRALPPDAHRWLRKRTWEDWQTPPDPSTVAQRRGQQTLGEKTDIILRGTQLAADAGLIDDDEEPRQEPLRELA